MIDASGGSDGEGEHCILLLVRRADRCTRGNGVEWLTTESYRSTMPQPGISYTAPDPGSGRQEGSFRGGSGPRGLNVDGRGAAAALPSISNFLIASELASISLGPVVCG